MGGGRKGKGRGKGRGKAGGASLRARSLAAGIGGRVLLLSTIFFSSYLYEILDLN